jgi:hypothetical protein
MAWPYGKSAAKLRDPEGFDDPEFAAATGYAHAVWVGDSHAKVGHFLNRENLPGGVRYAVRAVQGATTRGLVNPNSKTNALEIFQRRLSRAPAWQPLLFQLGEVDCGFVVWLRLQELGEPIHEQVRTVIDRYLRFLDRIRKQHPHVHVVSCPPPTVRGDYAWPEVNNARSRVKVPLEERTALTVEYNSLLSDACAGEGLPFIDVTSDTLDATTGIVQERFRAANPGEHHLSAEAHGPLIAEKLAPLIPSWQRLPRAAADLAQAH